MAICLRFPLTEENHCLTINGFLPPSTKLSSDHGGSARKHVSPSGHGYEGGRCRFVPARAGSCRTAFGSGRHARTPAAAVLPTSGTVLAHHPCPGFGGPRFEDALGHSQRLCRALAKREIGWAE